MQSIVGYFYTNYGGQIKYGDWLFLCSNIFYLFEINRISSNTIYLDFEDATDLKKADSADLLLNYVEQNKKDGKCQFIIRKYLKRKITN